MENIYMNQMVEVSDEGSSGGAQLFDPAYLALIDEGLRNDNSLMPPPHDPYYQGKTTRKTKAGLPTDKGYVCNKCFIPFTNSSNLKAHKRTHTGEKPYVCSICNLAFVQSSNLKAHLRTHSGERPYICDVCGQAFSRSSHLTGHKRTHTGEKPYICGTCGESFATSTHLRNHVRKHTTVTPFTCSICEVSFQQNSQLLAHTKIHNGDRPYKCCDCGGAFRSKGDLRSHRKLHTDDRPFICGKCGKTFKTYQYLMKHLSKCTFVVPGDDSMKNLTAQNYLDTFVHGRHGINHAIIKLSDLELPPEKNNEPSVQVNYIPTTNQQQMNIDENSDLGEFEIKFADQIIRV